MGILFNKSTHSLKVYAPGSFINGRFIKGAETVTSLSADIQPLTTEEVERLTIGDRNIGKIKIYCNTSLNIANSALNQSGDLVLWVGDNQVYEILAKETRDNGLLNHYKYIAELRKNVN